MYVVYAADHNFISKCGISLTSLLRNNPSMNLEVFLLDFGMTEEDRSLLRKVKPDIVFVDTKHALDERAVDTGHFNPVVLVRLLLAEYLPSDVNEALYLDSDTVVNGPLEELESFSFRRVPDDQSDETGRHGDRTIPGQSGKERGDPPAVDNNPDKFLLAAVPELYMPESKKRFLGLSREDTYYNAGVLWVNLKAWREEKLSHSFFAYYEEMGGSLPYNDQDIINHCCRGRIRTLPQKYNMNPNLPYFPYWYMRRVQPAYCEGSKASSQRGADLPSLKSGVSGSGQDDRTYYENQIRHPVIVHYMGDERPWLEGNYNYYRGLYEQYKAESLWAEEPPEPANRGYLLGYHVLNQVTRVMPHFRMLFTNLVGINIYKWKKKN